MIKRTITQYGKVIDKEGTPVCGDYCEQCGDCLHCFTEDGCYPVGGGEHSWVVYD